MSGTRPGALFREALRAPTFSLRGTLLRFAVISLGVGIWSAAVSTPVGFLIALMVAVVLVLLALATQELVERSGAVDRDRLEEELILAEMEGWPDWKKIAFFVVALLAGVGVIALRMWTDTWR